eukprot:CAMPEP_0184060694 /NCGR_PEP_ID=MMETSP0956-20121227/10945_1 /TAXON_ID=627963 /ORGANISM="Aplanochytrium sp, Strain PBS07" /LENGTH=258 /DNA_ID=CAMNT_0026356799 /DNA_START=584 /DNA_END=1357 /DNA_ORIENTATION=-
MMSAECRIEENDASLKKLRVWTEKQEQLSKQLILEDRLDGSLGYPIDFTEIKTVGGFDISFKKGSNQACAAFVVISVELNTVVYKDVLQVNITEPYVSSFLAFREVEPFQLLFQRFLLRRKTNATSVPSPEVLFVDGNGVFHPKGFGLACHLGVVLDKPTIGIAKSCLNVDGLNKERILKRWQNLDSSIEKQIGKATYIYLKGNSGRVWGAAFKCTSDILNPIYVSQGHRISLKSAIELTVKCCKYRIPEPVRQADIF